MDDELKTKLLEWLNATESFVTEQAPDIAQQMLAWGNMVANIQLMIAGILFLLALWCVWIFARHVDKANNDDDSAQIVCVISGVGAMICLLVILGLAIDGGATKIKIAVAPKVYLIDRLTN